MKKVSRSAAIASLVLAMICAEVSGVASAEGINTGLLRCHVAGGFGWIIGSTRTMDCHFEPTSGPIEDYTGSVSTIGLDFGYLGSSVIVWAVAAPTTSTGPGALAGNYFGVSAQAAAGAGLGVSVLAGGFEKSITLQPISVMGDTGLYVGGGVTSMVLHPSDF